jgi:hypothetical protein
MGDSLAVPVREVAERATMIYKAARFYLERCMQKTGSRRNQS